MPWLRPLDDAKTPRKLSGAAKSATQLERATAKSPLLRAARYAGHDRL